MSDTTEDLLNPNVVTMLHEMEIVFSKLGIDYYLAGALARDVQFKNRKSDTNFRRTDDVDLAVCLESEAQFNEVVQALEATGSFTQKKKEPIKLQYRLGIEVDLIPFGGIENEQRVVKLLKPVVFTLDMPGFAEVAGFTQEIKSGDLVLKTCPLEGLILLKLISWDDRPQRTHDLTDIDNIIRAYFDWNADEIYEFQNDTFDKYEDVEDSMWQSTIAAHVIGRKMKPMLSVSPDLRERIVGILKERPDPLWQAIKNGLTEP